MRVDVIMPQMGESIAEGTLTRWLKKTGERVERDEPIFEISTDKVDAEIPSSTAGVLAEIMVKEGETVPVNAVVARIETDATRQEAPAGPSAGGGTSSSTMPSPRPSAPPAGAPAAPIPGASRMAASGAGVEELRRVRSSPLVRRMAREHGVDLTRIEGTGLSGRVSRKDILRHLEGAAGAGPAIAPGARAASAPGARSPSYAPGERVSIEPMSPMRKKIAEHMVLSRRTSAHVTTVFEVDMHRVMRLRSQHQDPFLQRHGVKLTVTPFFLKAVVEALKAFPVVNAALDGDNIVYKKDIHLGVAVALDWGLIVPVIHQAGDKSLSGLTKELTDLAARARARKLTPEEVQGGTFTLTNPGSYGSLFGTPIINQPQVAIMGVGAIVKRPVVVDDAIAIHPMVYLALSFDHRLLDGAIADQFMAHVKETLEQARFPVVV